MWWVCDVCLRYVLVSVWRVCYAAAGVAGGVCSTSTGGAGVAARVTRIRVACAAPAASVSGVLLVGWGIGNSVM